MTSGVFVNTSSLLKDPPNIRRGRCFCSAPLTFEQLPPDYYRTTIVHDEMPILSTDHVLLRNVDRLVEMPTLRVLSDALLFHHSWADDFAQRR